MVQVKKSLNLRNCHKHRVGRLAVIDSSFADLLSDDDKREVHSMMPEDIGSKRNERKKRALPHHRPETSRRSIQKATKK